MCMCNFSAKNIIINFPAVASSCFQQIGSDKVAESDLLKTKLQTYRVRDKPVKKMEHGGTMFLSKALVETKPALKESEFCKLSVKTTVYSEMVIAVPNIN